MLNIQYTAVESCARNLYEVTPSPVPGIQSIDNKGAQLARRSQSIHLMELIRKVFYLQELCSLQKLDSTHL